VLFIQGTSEYDDAWRRVIKAICSLYRLQVDSQL